MAFDFNGKSVVVTGAGSGMGRAEALALAAAGATVWAADINEDAVRNVAAQIRDGGGTANPVRLDVADPGSWKEFSERAGAGGGVIHGLVNNAGIVQRAPILATSDGEWERTMSINLSGVFYGMRSLHPMLAAAGGASIVNISSVAGLCGFHSSAYGASKWGVRSLTKTAALEFAGDRIRVNSVHPGLIETPLLESNPVAASFADKMIGMTPLGRKGTAAEVADVVLFLLSEASSYMTGAELTVDGGYVSSGQSYLLSQASHGAMT